MKILIVDDNTGVRRVIRHALAGIAAEVVECLDGDEVLALYEEHRPDVVLMDVHMLRMDGLTATAHLKMSAPEAVVVILTDIDDEAIRSLAAEAGASGYIVKEDIVLLDEIIARILEAKHRRAQTEN